MSETDRCWNGFTTILGTVTDQLAANEVDDPATLTPDADVGDLTELEDASATPVEQSGPFARFRRSDRISRWDRPPEPHDWRFWVGNLGKVLIATGLLLFGFVAYQLWGTGIETARAQNELENQFEDGLVEADIDHDSIPAAVDVDDDAADTDTSGPVDDLNASDVDNDPAVRPERDDTPDPGSADISSGDRTEESLPQIADDAATVPVAGDLTDAAVEQPERRVVAGEVLARLEIPRIGRTDYIVPGVSLEALKKGPGHYPDTPLPGQLGNASIAGHRTTSGAPFFDVDQLGAGDELIVTYTNGDRFVYEVTFVEVVSATDYYVVTTSDPNIAEMTLTSCDPKYTARDRIVVHSVLNAAKSSNVGVATFYELDPDPNEQPIPGDDPVVAGGADPELDANEITEPDSVLGESPDPGPADVTEPADGEQADDTEQVTEPVVDDDGEQADDTEQVTEPVVDDDGDESAPDAPPVADRAVPAGETTERPDGDVTTSTDDEPTPVDAFSQGWFDDRDAFPQIALWGLLLTIISLLAYQVSKKTRRDSIGFLVGIAPFLFALYFFYQNVNRLLPPGI